MRSNCRRLLEYQINEDGSSLEELKRYFTNNLGALYSALNFLRKREFIYEKDKLIIKTKKGIQKTIEIRDATEIFFLKEKNARQKQREEVLRMYATIM